MGKRQRVILGLCAVLLGLCLWLLNGWSGGPGSVVFAGEEAAIVVPASTALSPSRGGLVRTDGELSNRERLPAVSVESGRRLHMVARVILWDEGERPLPGARCEVGLGLYAAGVGQHREGYVNLDQAWALTEATCDGDGVLELDFLVPAEELERGESLVVYVKCVEPGYIECFSYWHVDQVEGDTVEFRIETARGGTLRGQVVDARGEPVPEAWMGLYERSVDDEGATTWEFITVGKGSNLVGDFEFDFSLGETPGPYRLFASHPELGTGFIEGVWLDALKPERELQVRLSGAGVIAGRLVDSLGQPVEGYRLGAYAESLSADERESWRGDALIGLEVEGRGSASLDRVTDAEGRFRFTGLRPGLYWILRQPEKGRELDLSLTEAPVATGQTAIELLLDHCVLVVEVLDSEGQRLAVWPEMERGRYKPHADLFMYFEPTKRESGPYGTGRRVLTQGGLMVLEVEPGKEYRYGIVSYKHPLYEGLVTIDESARETRLRVQLQPEAKWGTLEVHDLRPKAERGSTKMSGGAGGVLTRVDFEFERAYGEQLKFRLPAGHHVVAVTYGFAKDSTTHASFEREVHIRPGQTTSIEITSGAVVRVVR